MLLNDYVDRRQTFSALKMKLVKGRGYETCNTKDGKKEQKAEAKEDGETEEEDAPGPLFTLINSFLHSIFSTWKCTSASSKLITQMDSMRTNLFFPTTSWELSLNTRKFCSARGNTMKKIVKKLWKRQCLNFFFTGRMKMNSRPEGFMYYGKLRVEFPSTSE